MTPNEEPSYSFLEIIWWVHHKELSASDRIPGKGSTISRGHSTSAPELSSSVALVPLLKGFGILEELNVHPYHEV